MTNSKETPFYTSTRFIPLVALLVALSAACDSKPKEDSKQTATPASSAPASPAASPPANTAVADAATTAQVADAGAADPAKKPTADLKVAEETSKALCACTDMACVEAIEARVANDYGDIKDEDEEAAKPLLEKARACVAKLGGATAGDASQVVKLLQDAAKQACACQDIKCLQASSQSIQDAAKKVFASVSNPKDIEAVQTAMTAYGACATKIAMATTTPVKAAATAETASPTVGYASYKNQDGGYMIDVPTFFTRAATTSTGATWKWQDRAQMDVASYEAKDVKAMFEAGKKETGATYSSFSNGSYMITGKKAGKIFYVHGFGDETRTFVMRLAYNEDMKTFFDPIVSHVKRSFRIVQ